MNTTTLTLCTIADATALVITLAIFLVEIARRLRAVVRNLLDVQRAVADIAAPAAQLVPLAAAVNEPLRDITAVLPVIAERAEALARKS